MSKLSDALLALAKDGVLNGMQRTDIADELVALAAQAKELERDAERWQRVRTGNVGAKSLVGVWVEGGMRDEYPDPDGCDAAIDKERGQ